MKRKLIAVCLSIAMMSSMLVACGTSKNSEKNEKKEEKVLNVGISEMYDVIEPAGNQYTNVVVANAFYDYLYTVGAEGEVTYYLAESCEQSEDGMTFTVKLRDNATWSDGEPITAEDVIFTVNYYQNYVEGATTTLLSGYSVKEIDEKTVEFKTDTFVDTFFYDLGSLRVHPSHVFEGDINKVEGSEFMSSDKIVTSSPFKLVEWNKGESYVFEVRDDYYGEKPGYDKLNLIYIPEANARQLAFENGELSYIEVTTAEEIEKYNSDDYNIHQYLGGKVWHLQYNPDGQKGEGLSDDARKAISLAIDGNEIADTVFGNELLAQAANSSFSVAEGFYNEDVEHKTDVEVAKKLAEESGITEKELTMIYNVTSPVGESLGVVIQQQLARIGVKANLQGYDPTAFYPRVFHVMQGDKVGEAEKSDWDFAIGFETSMYGDAHFSHKTYAGMNLFGDEASALVLKAGTTVDAKEREALYKEAQIKNEESNYWIPLVEENGVMVGQKNVLGLDNYKYNPGSYGYGMLSIK